MNTEPTDDEQAGIEWWNRQRERERRYWLKVANSARPADAWAAFKRSGEADATRSPKIA